jgi:hypothetical protein
VWRTIFWSAPYLSLASSSCSSDSSGLHDVKPAPGMITGNPSPAETPRDAMLLVLLLLLLVLLLLLKSPRRPCLPQARLAWRDLKKTLVHLALSSCLEKRSS